MKQFLSKLEKVRKTFSELTQLVESVQNKLQQQFIIIIVWLNNFLLSQEIRVFTFTYVLERLQIWKYRKTVLIDLWS